jgi:hypothetical protein
MRTVTHQTRNIIKNCGVKKEFKTAVQPRNKF